MTRWSRSHLPCLLFAAICAACAVTGGVARTVSGDATGLATLVAWFVGIELHATIAGEMQISGEISGDGAPVAFCAEGTLRGYGLQRIATLVTDGWIGYVAEGHTAQDEPIDVRGLLYVHLEGIRPLVSGELASERHVVRMSVGGETVVFFGEMTGTVQGALERPDCPGRLQLAGSGTVWLEGVQRPDPLPEPIPLDHPALPADFLLYLAELGFGV